MMRKTNSIWQQCINNEYATFCFENKFKFVLVHRASTVVQIRASSRNWRDEITETITFPDTVMFPIRIKVHNSFKLTGIMTFTVNTKLDILER
jgi:hypothetical protein